MGASSEAGANAAVADALCAAVRCSRLWDVGQWFPDVDVFQPGRTVVRTGVFVAWVHVTGHPPRAHHVKACLLSDCLLLRARLPADTSLCTPYRTPTAPPPPLQTAAAVEAAQLPAIVRLTDAKVKLRRLSVCVEAVDMRVTLLAPAGATARLSTWSTDVSKCIARSTATSPRRRPTSRATHGVVKPRGGAGPATPRKPVVYCGTLSELLRECVDPVTKDGSPAPALTAPLMDGLLLVLPTLVGAQPIVAALHDVMTTGTMAGGADAAATRLHTFMRTWAQAEFGSHDLLDAEVHTLALQTLEDFPAPSVQDSAVPVVCAAAGVPVPVGFEERGGGGRAEMKAGAGAGAPGGCSDAPDSCSDQSRDGDDSDVDGDDGAGSCAPPSAVPAVGSVFSRSLGRTAHRVSQAELWSIDHLDCDPAVVAVQLALLDQEARDAVSERDVMRHGLTSPGARLALYKDTAEAGPMRDLLQFQEQLYSWMCVEVLQQPLDTAGQHDLLRKLVKLAAACRAQHSYNCMAIIVKALTSPFLQGLQTMWAYVKSDVKEQLDELAALINPHDDFAAYRREVDALPAGTAVLTCVAADVADMTTAQLDEHAVLLEAAATAWHADLVLPSACMAQIAQSVARLKNSRGRPRFDVAVDLMLRAHLNRCLTRAPKRAKLQRLAQSRAERDTAVFKSSMEAAGFF